MINRPCPLNVACVCSLGSPFENLSSEAPDPIDFISMDFYGWTPPINGGVGSLTNGGGTGGQNNWNRNHTIGTGNSSVNQQLANEAAERDANNNAWNPPGRNPAQTVYGNTAQTVTLDCPDGTSFSYTVPAGTYTALDQTTADQRALQQAQKNAPANQVCITKATLAGACLGEDYNDTLTATGGTLFEWGNYFWQATSGALPDGVTLDEQTGEISGTPTGSGSFTFTITVADYFFNTTSKDYTITVAEITTDTLPSAVVSQVPEYSETIAASPAGGVFALAGGNLPASLILASDGILSGTPGVGDNGVYTFSVSYTIGTTVCTKSLSLRIWDAENFSVGLFTADNTGASVFFSTLTPGKYKLNWKQNTGLYYNVFGDVQYIRMAGGPDGCGSFPISVTEFGDVGVSIVANGADPGPQVSTYFNNANPLSVVDITVNTDIYHQWAAVRPVDFPIVTCGYSFNFDLLGSAPQFEVIQIGKP